MKKTILLFLLVFAALTSRAVTVKLKITYNDAPVADCDVTIKQGDVTLGQGRTNADGDVEIEASVLAGNAIDVYGSKQTADGAKTWDVKGVVKLDDDNFYHLQMEVFAQQMAHATGMPEATIAGMWGILIGGSNDAPAVNPGTDGGGQ